MNNNNRNNNNRRRGRGNNNRQPGGQQVNRIDSRARGNAPQMLEKYRKLALDSHMNGDRVNEEYYLQFADHYFRVIADTRVRQDETRPRRDDRWQDGNGDSAGERDFEYADDAVDPYEDMRQGGGDRHERYERPEHQERTERQERPERAERQDRTERQERGERPERQERVERPQRVEPVAAQDAGEPFAETPSQEAEPRSVYEPPENPFVRGDRNEGRGLKQRRPRRAAHDDQAVDQAGPADQSEPAADVAGDAGPSPLDVFDAAILPPGLALSRPDTDADAPVGETEPVKPRRRTRRPRVADGSDETLQAVS